MECSAANVDNSVCHDGTKIEEQIRMAGDQGRAIMPVGSQQQMNEKKKGLVGERRGTERTQKMCWVTFENRQGEKVTLQI